MLQRLLCLLLGYLCGCFLTAELVARARTGKSAAALGTGNPGMANLAHELGKGWGAVVLAGDIAKTALAFGLCRALFPALGGLSGRPASSRLSFSVSPACMGFKINSTTGSPQSSAWHSAFASYQLSPASSRV